MVTTFYESTTVLFGARVKRLIGLFVGQPAVLHMSYLDLNSVCRFTTRSFLRALRNVVSEYRLSRIHVEGLRRAKRYVGQKGLRLHAGCGPNIKTGFVNIDMDRRADVPLDLREPLPFENNSCSFVYSEHFVEHLEYPSETNLFFAESFRVLNSGGVFSVGVPDAEWPIRAYAGDPKFSEWFGYVLKEYPKSKLIRTRVECVNHSFRQGTEHKFAWDFETMKYALEMVGFRDVRKREFDPTLDSTKSRHAIDDDPTKCTTLYVEAVKP